MVSMRLRRVLSVNVVKVTGARPGEPAVRLVDDDGEPVAEVDGFLRLLAVREYSPNTIRAYAHDLQKLFAFLGEARITAAEFTPARAVEFLQWLRLVSSSRRAQRLELGVASGGGRVLSAKTCNRVMAAVSSFYEFLIASEAYAGRDNPIVKVADQAAARVPGRYRPPLDNASRQQPVRRVLRVKTVEALPRPMAAEVYDALLGELRTRRDRALLEVMWEGGLRPGEVLGLRLEDISYGQRRVAVRKRDDHPRQVRQKSRRDRVVDLLEGRALPALNDYVMRERPADADCPWVFLVGGKGKRRCEPLGYDALVRMFARAAGRAGVRDAWLTPHSLRHTHATRMFEGGMRELTLMTRLGHATPDSMKVYTRVSDPEVLKDYRRATGGGTP
jgi:integrase